MVNKLVTTVGKFAARKIANKTAEKIFDTYDYASDRVLFGSKPLNIR